MCASNRITNDKMADEQRNTVKVAVLEIDATIKDLVAISFYDSKPVYLFSTVIPEVTWIIPGEKAAQEGLHAFLTQRFKLYEKRNDPTINATSNLSPWLHFGQIAAQRCALEAKKIPSTKSRDSFLEELIIRRELTDNYCFYNRDGYDKLNGLYPQYNN